jgi:hypothetical protein
MLSFRWGLGFKEAGMRVSDRITAERLTADQAYERFFDGFYNLGKPSEIFERTIVLSPMKIEPTKARRAARGRRSGQSRKAIKHFAGRK